MKYCFICTDWLTDVGLEADGSSVKDITEQTIKCGLTRIGAESLS